MYRMLVSSLILAGLAFAACSEATTDPESNRESPSQLSIDPQNSQANGELRGQVVGETEPGGELVVVADAAIDVYHLVLDPANPNDTTPSVREFEGSLVTDAEGRFEITSIPEGEYSLDIVPPESSPFEPQSAWAFVSSGDDVQEERIVLRVGGAAAPLRSR